MLAPPQIFPLDHYNRTLGATGRQVVTAGEMINECSLAKRLLTGWLKWERRRP